MKKLRVAWFSPLSSDPNGSDSLISVYFTETILPFMRDRFEIELFHNGFDSYADYETYHYLNAAIRHEKNPFDLFFYQVEDSKAVDFIRMHIGVIPGIVLFHDYKLSTDGPEPILHSAWQSVVEKFNNNALDWHERFMCREKVSDFAHREGAFSILPLFSKLENSSEYLNIKAQRTDEFLSCVMQSVYLPVPVLNFDKTLACDGSLKVAYAGQPKISHRVDKVLAAVANSSDVKEFHWMIDVSEEGKAKELLAEFFGSSWQYKVRLHFNRTPKNWDCLVRECNVALHPFFGEFGSTSPYLEISLAHNLAVITSNYELAETLSDDLIFRVSVGKGEEKQILEIFSFLVSCKNSEFHFSEKARELFDAEMIATNLAILFDDKAKLMKKIYQDWRTFQNDARNTLIQELVQFVKSQKKESGLRGIADPKFAWEQCFKPIMKSLGWIS